MPAELVDLGRDPRWDSWLDQFDAASCFHASAWAKLLQETYGAHSIGLVALDEAHSPLAMIPVSWAPRRFRSVKATSVPFADFAEPLARDAASRSALMEALLTHGRSRQWGTIEIRGGTPAGADSAASTEYWQHELDLRPGPDALLAAMADGTRRSVRKAERSGLRAEVSTSLASVHAYFELHCLTRQRLGSPPQPRAFFVNLWKHFIEPGHGFVVTVLHEGQPAASLIVLTHRDRAVYKFGASDHRQQALRPNNLAMWWAIRHCIDQRMTRLHFGRTSMHDDGLRRYKNGWGCQESVLQYFRIDLATGAHLAVPDIAGGWTSSVVRRMPVGLVTRLGGALYRHLL
jgi:3-phenylpropionate/cinnamic acid dioxygenase small subunit